MSRVRCAVVCRIKACSFRPLVGLVILRSAFSACTSPLSFIVISRGGKKVQYALFKMYISFSYIRKSCVSIRIT